jgi:hypothetical protein
MYAEHVDPRLLIPWTYVSSSALVDRTQVEFDKHMRTAIVLDTIYPNVRGGGGFAEKNARVYMLVHVCFRRFHTAIALLTGAWKQLRSAENTPGFKLVSFATNFVIVILCSECLSALKMLTHVVRINLELHRVCSWNEMHLCYPALTANLIRYAAVVSYGCTRASARAHTREFMLLALM